MLCNPSCAFSYQLVCWFLASFQHLHIFLLAAEGNTSLCFFWMRLLILSHCWERQWTLNSHLSSSYQLWFSRCLLKYFFSWINHLASISSHRNHLLPFIILAASLHIFFNLILPFERNRNCAPMVDWLQIGIVASGHLVVWYLFLAQ